MDVEKMFNNYCIKTRTNNQQRGEETIEKSVAYVLLPIPFQFQQLPECYMHAYIITYLSHLLNIWSANRLQMAL